MQRDGLSFQEACQRLGAWDEDHKRTGKPLPRRLVPVLVMDFTIDGVEYHAEVPDEPRTELQQTRRFYTQAKGRLTELHRGDTERFEGEADAQSGIMAAAWENIQIEVGR
jgi:hypothetical protein